MKALFKQQRMVVWGALLLGACVAGLLLFFVLRDESVPLSQESLAKVDTKLPASPQEVFHHKVESKTDLLEKNLEAQGKLLEAVMTKLDALSSASQSAGDAQIHQQIQALEQKLNAQSAASIQPSLIQEGMHAIGDKKIRRVVLNLSQAKKRRIGKTVDTVIPSGSFVRAILLEGVDASTSVVASSDPKPTLLRIVDHGTLPRGFQSDLKDCHVTAASYGDMSSERAYIRLEKMSCVERATGETIQMNVQGHVSGEDGRAGVRGRMIDRTGPLMRNSFAAGFLGSLGGAAGQIAGQNPLLSTPLGIQQNPVGIQNLMQQGAGKGVQNAMDQYAQFYIKRAEQMQPVIVIEAGREVTLVFSEEVSMNPTLVRSAITQSKEGHRIQRAEEIAQDVVVQSDLKG